MIVKLARGHVAYQYSEPQLDDPTYVAVMPLTLMFRRAARGVRDGP